MCDLNISPKDIEEALMEVASAASPIRTSADALESKAAPSLMQVFFLPCDDIDDPAAITAFCPFTGIAATGAFEFFSPFGLGSSEEPP